MTLVLFLLAVLLALSLAGSAVLWHCLRREAQTWQESAAQQRAQRHQLAEEIAGLEAAEASIEKAVEEARRARDEWKAEAERLLDRIRSLDSDLALWKAKAEHWQEQYERANADAIKARETVADWIAQRTFGKSIFSHAPALPERANVPKPVAKQRVQGRVAVQMAERQFNEAYADLMRGKSDPPAAAAPPERAGG
jgi:septal ring factor EnvC (AmiA/AmiB activator)